MAVSSMYLRPAYMARHYQAIFESLASEFDIALVAGSIALPNPLVADGQLFVREGPVYNTTAVFTPAGICSA